MSAKDDILEYWIDESRWDPGTQYADLNVAGWSVTGNGLTYLTVHFGPEGLARLDERDRRFRISVSASRSPRGLLAFLINVKKLEYRSPGIYRYEVSEERHGEERVMDIRTRCGNGLELIKEEFRAVYRTTRAASNRIRTWPREPSPPSRRRWSAG